MINPNQTPLFKQCEQCDRTFTRRRYPSGRFETPQDFQARPFCSQSCAHIGKRKPAWVRDRIAASMRVNGAHQPQPVHSFVSAHPDGGTLEEVGAALGLSTERVRQIEEIALLKVAAGLNRIDPDLGAADAIATLRSLARERARKSAERRAAG